MEEWREVIAKDTKFLVNRMGDVRTPTRHITYTRTRNGKPQTFTATMPEEKLTPQRKKTGYLEIQVRYQGKRTRIAHHRLVALAFVPGYADDLCVNHINGVKDDNRPENLEWVSLARNTEHAWETGLVDLHGENQPTAKLTSKRVAYIRKLLNQGISPHTIAIVAGMSDALIYLIRDGKRWARDAAHDS